MKRILIVCLMMMASLVRAGDFDLTVKQWTDFMNQVGVPSGGELGKLTPESVTWRVKIRARNLQRIAGCYYEDLLICDLMPADDLEENKKFVYPVTVICDKTNGAFNDAPGEILVVNGWLMGKTQYPRNIALKAQTILDKGTK